MSRGGKRPGAGKPKGHKASHTLAAQTFRKYLIRRVIKEKKPVIDALLKAAKEKNVVAIKEIMDRVIGKPTDNVDITTKGEKIYNWQDYAQKPENKGKTKP